MGIKELIDRPPEIACQKEQENVFLVFTRQLGMSRI